VPAIVVDQLRKSYQSRTGQAVEAVRGVSFTVAEGEVFALLGPNGAGKTTTLEICEGYRQRDAGTVSVLGMDPGAGGQALRSRVGLVLQETTVESFLTVREVLQRNAGYYPRPREVDEVLELVGLTEKASARAGTLSGGQQRRLDVALGIVGRPDLLFLDEPTTGFDPSARRVAWDMVRGLTGGGTTIVLTTHYMDEAQALADRVAVIADGRIVAEGTPESIGGRDRAAVRIRFRLPADVPGDHLPVPAEPADHGAYELHTDDELRVLHTLTGWALDRGVHLEELVVDRPSLEDIYLALTGDSGPAAAAPTGAGPVSGRRTR
jgi:ABC-2 type transport system ATP-binding protein